MVEHPGLNGAASTFNNYYLIPEPLVLERVKGLFYRLEGLQNISFENDMEFISDGNTILSQGDFINYNGFKYRVLGGSVPQMMSTDKCTNHNLAVLEE